MPSCVHSQPYSHAKHFLLSVGGARWKEMNLVMFTVFIDDSGTDPNQDVAIAAALVIPSARLVALEREWNKIRAGLHFDFFHSSACAFKNPKTEFADWDDKHIRALFVRVRHLTKKYGIQAISFAVCKGDYDEAMPIEMRDQGGRNHYTWAIREVLNLLDNWAFWGKVSNPFEYLIDWVDPKSERLRRNEIEMVFAQKESDFPGRFEGHYEFKKSRDFPGLQCADLLAWSCYQIALDAFNQKTPHPLGNEAFYDFERHRFNWLFAMTMTKSQLSNWVSEQMSNPTLNHQRDEWAKRYREQKKLAKVSA